MNLLPENSRNKKQSRYAAPAHKSGKSVPCNFEMGHLSHVTSKRQPARLAMAYPALVAIAAR